MRGKLLLNLNGFAPPQPVKVKRVCMKCQNEFTSTGDRLCWDCNEENKKLSRLCTRECISHYPIQFLGDRE